jgi:trimeric autotransporter adhesin
VRHLGPMAQDFHARFGLGDDDRTYNSVDAHGVALAAIQALDRMVAAQEKRIQSLERENRRLARRLGARDSHP